MKTLLVDGNNILMRSVYAAKASNAQMSVDGTSTASLVIFIGLIGKYVRAVQPTHMAVMWDAGHDFRDAAYPSYKAARAKSGPDGDDSIPFALAKEFLTWAGVPHKAHKGYEADDLIAATARQCQGEVMILSGDKDLLQLLDYSPERQVYQIRVPDEVPWSAQHVDAKFSVPPHHLADYLALVGDPGDGVPGVAGIGPKKAVALLERAEWDWEKVVDLLGPEKGPVAVTMKSLVDLRTYPYDEMFLRSNAGAPAFNPTTPEHEHTWLVLEDFLDRYRLEQVRERLRGGTMWSDPSSSADLFENFETPA